MPYDVSPQQLADKTIDVDVYKHEHRYGFKRGDLNVKLALYNEQDVYDRVEVLMKELQLLEAKHNAMQKVTPSSVDEAVALEEECQAEMDRLNDERLKVILERFLSWDVLENGEPVPLTYEAVSKNNVLRMFVEDTIEASKKVIKPGESKGRP